MTLLGVALLLVGGLATWRLVRDGGPYRSGAWPGLSARGAGVLLACAVLLGGGQLVLARPRMPLPDLPLLAVFALLPLAFATRTVHAPGAASAVCGAYLLPRTLASLQDPSIELPPLLLVPALAFDLAAWLRMSDLANLRPRPKPSWRGSWGWRKRDRRPRRVGRGRIAFAGGIFGIVVSATEPSFAVLLGGDPLLWSGTPVLLAGALSALACALLGPVVSGRDTTL